MPKNIKSIESKKRVAVLGVIFPQMRSFLSEYLQSLKNQTYKEFDLIIINDGLKGFAELAEKYQLNIKEIKFSGSIAQNRELGINYIKNSGYNYLIFTDSDDYFAPNRIKKSVEFLKFYDIVVNDLILVSTKGRVLNKFYFSNRLKNLSEINFNFIRDKNIFGLSNTALRVSCLKEKIKFKDYLIAVDWNLFSRLLKERHSAIFTNETVTFYRIYEGNLVGLPITQVSINEEKIKKDVETKRRHYQALSGQDKTYEKLATDFHKLAERINDQKYKSIYLNKVKSLHINRPFWYEEIKLFKNLK